MFRDPVERGVDTHIPWVNRLVSWWASMKGRGWLEDAHEHQIAALLRDLHPVIVIYKELYTTLPQPPKGGKQS